MTTSHEALFVGTWRKGGFLVAKGYLEERRPGGS